MMSASAETTEPNTRRSRRHVFSTSIPGTADDFPTSFHVPSRRSVRRRLSEPPEFSTGMVSSTSDMHRKRKEPSIASSSQELQHTGVAAPADYPLLMMLVRFCIYAFILIGSIGSMFLPFFYNMYCTSKQLARLQSHIFPCLDLHRCHDFLDNQLTTPIDKMKPCLSALICQLTIYCTLGSCFVVYFVKNMLCALANLVLISISSRFAMRFRISNVHPL